jgi:hypothetical protein
MHFRFGSNMLFSIQFSLIAAPCSHIVVNPISSLERKDRLRLRWRWKIQIYLERNGTQAKGKKLNIEKHVKKRRNSVAYVCERNQPTERQPLVGKVPTLADRRCCVVSVTDLHGRILVLLDRSRYYFFRTVPQLYSLGWVHSVPDPLLLSKSDSDGNGTWDLWICSQHLWPLDHRGGLRRILRT